MLYDLRKNIFISLAPFVLLLSLLNTYGFTPYNSEHFSILIIFLIIYIVEKLIIRRVKTIKFSLFIIGILTFIAINCKIQSALILTLINLYLLFKIKNKLNIFYIVVGFFLSYLPFIIFAFYSNNLHSVSAFWLDNIYYAIFGLNDEYKDNFLNEVITIFSVPDTKYFYLFSFLFFIIATTIIFRIKLYRNEYLAYSILTLISLYTVIAPQFLFLHYFFTLYSHIFCFFVS